MVEPSHNLPLQLTSFVGRERALADLEELLATTRLLTLTGPPGVGKTRLALELALHQVDAFADGVWLVELASLADPALLPQTVATALGVRERSGEALPDTLAEALRARRLLLVLDNCEHLVDACAALAEHLLRAGPRLRILATSREGLGIAGETTWWVSSLALPDTETLPASEPDRLAAVKDCAAVRLFAERAGAVLPSFAVTAENARPVAEVCRRLDGIPLALELAAVRVRALSVDELARRLGDRFRLLAGADRTALPRQQTLRAAVDWSYALLPEPERVLLRRLAVFAGGWTLDAAEQVCAGDGIASEDVLELLVQLVNKSLVVVEVHAELQRYRLLEMIREYADEKLSEAGEEAMVRQRHLGWLRAMIEATPRFLRGPEGDAWLDRFEQELDNLRAALTWSRREFADPESMLRLAGGTWEFWYRRGRLSEGRGWIEAALAAGGGSAAARAQALVGAFSLAHVQGDSERAETLAREALALYRELADRQGTGWCLFALGILAQSRGDHKRAAALGEESLVLLRQAGDRLGSAIALGGLGMLAHQQGVYGRAAALYEQALALYRERADRYGIGWSLHYLGLAAGAQGDRDRARSLLEESVKLRHEIGDAEGLAGCLEGLAALEATTGRPERAARLLGAAVALRQAIGTPVPASERAEHQRTLATVRAGLGVQAFEAAWAEGHAMRPDQAAAYALADEEPTPPAARGSTGAEVQAAPGGLSRRELEVAALIARGHTNRQIAEQLVISEWTVDSHVRHILTKLGFRSRAQVATWTAEQGQLG